MGKKAIMIDPATEELSVRVGGGEVFFSGAWRRHVQTQILNIVQITGLGLFLFFPLEMF